jgi:hypothetical protein
LVEKGWEGREKAKRQAKRREWSRDEKETLKFVNTEGCRRLVMMEYFDEQEPVDCISGEIARCDRCGSGVTDWERSQRNTAGKRGLVLDTLDQVANGCAVCWIAAAITGSGDWLHDGRKCETRSMVQADDGNIIDMTEQACDRFRGRIRYWDDSRTCFRCGISQKLCNTKEDGQGSCQWPGVAVPVLRAAMGNTIRRNIIRQAGCDAMVRWATGRRMRCGSDSRTSMELVPKCDASRACIAGRARGGFAGCDATRREFRYAGTGVNSNRPRIPFTSGLVERRSHIH